MAEFAVKLDNIEEKINNNRTENKELANKITQFIDAVDNKFEKERKLSDKSYANKNVEKLTYFVFGTIFTAVIIFFINS